MKRLNSDIGSTKGALQERPEVVYALRVYLTAHILARMIHNLMDEIGLAGDEAVTCSVIGMELASGSDCVQDCSLQCVAFDVRDLP